MQEQSWTYDILRKISPKEAELLNDPSINAKVRFRFAGIEFPPIILFKIYLVSNGTKYISGKKIIRPASYVSYITIHTHLFYLCITNTYIFSTYIYLCKENIAK